MNTVTGSIDTMSVPDLLQWLLTVAKTGVLSVEREGGSKRLYFARGTIVGASSSDPDLAFGQFLLDLGKVSEETLVALVRRQRESGVMLGKLLINEGILTEEEVQEVLRLKARETLFELMAWKEGTFSFTEQDIAETDQVSLELPIDSIIFEGIRKAEMRRKVKEAFPAGNVVPTVLADESRQLMLQDERAAPMVSLMDQGQSIREMARKLRLSVIDVCEVLYPFLRDGHVVVGVSAEPEIPSYYIPHQEMEAEDVPGADLASDDLGLPDPDKLVALAEELRSQGLLEEALATIERAIEVAPRSPRVTEAAGRVGYDFTTWLWTYFDGGESVPVLAVGLRDLPVVKPMLTAEEGYVATRVTGMDTVRHIVDNSPLPNVKTLRILYTFAEAELVIFRDRPL